ncbi:MAG: hypothetical protein PHE89_05230 [Alphaproteobacteria bacterium]|nr:hypothetical protein [Alphaproteobacteria bacterium]
MGYTYNSSNCSEGKSLSQKCPNGNFYKFCNCNRSLYPYTTENCSETGKVIGGKVCENTYYEKCDCEEKYQYDPENCPFPKTLSGISCNDKYETCACPSDYSKTCTGNLEGVGTSCDGKYQTCKCKSTFIKCDNGGATGATSCTDSTGTKYDSCKPSCSLSPASCAATYGGIADYWKVDEACTTCTADRKYVLTSESINFAGEKLYRIKALKDFTTQAHPACTISGDDRCNIEVKKGDLGGYVKTEANLSQTDNSWIADTAKVFGNAKVYESALVRGSAYIYQNAKIYGNTIIRGTSKIMGNAEVYGKTTLDQAAIYDYAKIYGSAYISNTTVSEYATVRAGQLSTGRITGHALVAGAYTSGDSSGCVGYVSGAGGVLIAGNAKVYSSVYLYCNATISGDAIINDYGSSYGWTVSIKDNVKINGTANINGTLTLSGDAKFCSGSYGKTYITPRPEISSGEYGC